MSAATPFARLVGAAMERRGLGLRELCRRAKLDPSFFSKVLAGKRSPPAEEEVLRRLAEALETDPVELVVAAGRLPREWSALWRDAGLLARVDGLARADARAPAPVRSSWSRPAVAPRPAAPASAPPPAQRPYSPKPFSEELL